jgi:putative peptidoglycan lipid II flippase
LFLNGLSSIWISILNAGERFALVALTPMATSILTVIVLIAWGRALGIYALVIGTVGGSLTEAGILAWGLKRHGFSIIPGWWGIDPHIKQVLNQFIPMSVGTVLMSSAVIVDQSMAAILGSGSVAILNYGNKAVAFILSITSLAMSTSIFPHYSKMVAANDWDSVQHVLASYSRLILLVGILLTIVLFLYSQPIVRMVFERGDFSQRDTLAVARVQAMYGFQITFYLLSILYVRLISAMKGNRILMWSTMMSFPLNILFNYILMKTIGVAGIALSTSLVYAISFMYLYIMSRHLIRKKAS